MEKGCFLFTKALKYNEHSNTPYLLDQKLALLSQDFYQAAERFLDLEYASSGVLLAP